MELLFGLVFVVAVHQVARRLSHAVTGGAVLGCLVLAVPVWWAWVGYVYYVYYVDRLGPDDLRDRLITLVPMGAALAFAGAAARGLESGSGAFALAYGTFRVVLALVIGFAMWWAYFETSDGAPVAVVQQDGRTGPYSAWLHAHLPLTAGIAAAAIAMQHKRWRSDLVHSRRSAARAATSATDRGRLSASASQGRHLSGFRAARVREWRRRIPLGVEPPERPRRVLAHERLGIVEGLLQHRHVLHRADVA